MLVEVDGASKALTKFKRMRPKAVKELWLRVHRFGSEHHMDPTRRIVHLTEEHWKGFDVEMTRMVAEAD